jgi:hypothetical protein
MSKELKTLFITLGAALVFIYLLKPKSSKKKDNTTDSKYSAPKEADSALQKEKENAVIGIQAMREAINSGESKAELDKLSAMILKEKGIRVILSVKTKLLKAVNKKGKVLAEEEMENK